MINSGGLLVKGNVDIFHGGSNSDSESVGRGCLHMMSPDSNMTVRDFHVQKVSISITTITTTINILLTTTIIIITNTTLLSS